MTTERSCTALVIDSNGNRQSLIVAALEARFRCIGFEGLTKAATNALKERSGQPHRVLVAIHLSDTDHAQREEIRAMPNLAPLYYYGGYSERDLGGLIIQGEQVDASSLPLVHRPIVAGSSESYGIFSSTEVAELETWLVTGAPMPRLFSPLRALAALGIVADLCAENLKAAPSASNWVPSFARQLKASQRVLELSKFAHDVVLEWSELGLPPHHAIEALTRFWRTIPSEADTVPPSLTEASIDNLARTLGSRSTASGGAA
jgi:hypothetical protein